MAYSHMMYKVGWDPSRVKEVLSEADISYSQLSEATGISHATLSQCLSGRMVPNVSLLMTIADYFGVSVDYLCGVGEHPEDFGKRYMQFRRLDYEATYKRRQGLAPSDRFGEAPYPYNLLDDVIYKSGYEKYKSEDGYWDGLLTPGQEEALQYILDRFLSEKERVVIKLYYEEGRSLEDIGKEFNVTRERIRQIILKVLRQLRHPSRFKPILYGLDGYKRYSGVQDKLVELEKEEHRVDEMERDLIFRRNYIESALLCSPVEVESANGPLSIEDMDLSVRTFNCLCRAGIRDLSGILRQVDKGYSSFLRIRNMGRKSVDEVFAKVQEITGVDYKAVALRKDEEIECTAPGRRRRNHVC